MSIRKSRCIRPDVLCDHSLCKSLRLKTPLRVGPIYTQQSTQIIVQDNVDVKAACDTPRYLVNSLISLGRGQGL